MRIVFMGTPDFAAASLKKLIDERFGVIAVYTQPDKPKGRGMCVEPSPVKKLALEYGIPVFQPDKIRTDEAKAQLKALNPDLLVVVAYGKMLPDEFITAPRLGAINVHGSLLPRYRGSAPIQWAVLNGDRYTGVTTMYISPKMDTGDVIYQDCTEIGEFETSGELFERLKTIGAKLLVQTIRDIGSGIAPREPQDEAGATYTVQLDKSMSPIDWNMPPRKIVKHIYGMQPWPVATMELGGVLLKAYAAEYTDIKTDKAPGEPVSTDKRGLVMACAGGETLRVTEVQAPGKKRMPMSSYLLGHRVEL